MQTLHRTCLRLYAPNQRVPDVTVRREDFFPDPVVKTTHDDWYAQALETEFGENLFRNTMKNNQLEQQLGKRQKIQNAALLQWKKTQLEQLQLNIQKWIEYPPTISRNST